MAIKRGQPTQRTEVSSPTQVLPVLTVHKLGSDAHVLRIFDMGQMQLALTVAKSLPPGKLVVVTPVDTKLFDLSSLGKPGQPGQSSPSRLSRPLPKAPVKPITEEGTEDENLEEEDEGEDAPDPMDEAMRLADTEGAEMEEQAARADGYNRRTAGRQAENSPNSACARCQGTGTTVAGGSCPVCRGTGEIRRFGAPPSRAR